MLTGYSRIRPEGGGSTTAAAAASNLSRSMAASSTTLRYRRLFFLSNNDNAAAGENCLNKKFKKPFPFLLPLRCKKSRMMVRSATNHLYVCSSAADQPAKMMMSSGTKEEEEEPVPVPANKLDEWIRESVTEIVRNIGEAPFLVHIYSSSPNEIHDNDVDGSSSSSKTKKATARRAKFEREPAAPEDWPSISRRWKENSSSKPDGVILVDQLKGDDEEEDRSSSQMVEYCSGGGGHWQCSKSWGIVIQGRGLAGAACYILKTTSSGPSSVGFCTHFCLVRAKCFGDPADLQLRDCWLQRQ